MKKYLHNVEGNLVLPADVRRRVMEDLRSTIEERREAGQTDEQIMAELGDPGQVAKELNSQMMDYVAKKSPWRFVFLITAALSFLGMVAACLSDLILSRILTDANNSLGIIGGADGPTAIFVTTQPGIDWFFLVMAIIYFASTAGWFWLRRRTK